MPFPILNLIELGICVVNNFNTELKSDVSFGIETEPQQALTVPSIFYLLYIDFIQQNMLTHYFFKYLISGAGSRS